MKKAKTKSSSRRRDRSPSEDSKQKRPKTRSKSREKEKKEVKKDTKGGPRKTRWEAEDKSLLKMESSKNVPVPEPATKKEKSGPPPPRIKDFLHDREKIVDLLFQTVTGAALEELIPDYLKKRPKDELKKLCLQEIKTLSDDDILQIISGKVDSSNKEEKVVEKQKEKISKLEQPSLSKVKEDKEIGHQLEKKLEDSNIDKAADILSDHASKLQTAPGLREEKTADEDGQIPLVIKDEVAKDLISPNRDAELLELEMRARAIRSLLKAKSQQTANEEESVAKDNK